MKTGLTSDAPRTPPSEARKKGEGTSKALALTSSTTWPCGSHYEGTRAPGASRRPSPLSSTGVAPRLPSRLSTCGLLPTVHAKQTNNTAFNISQLAQLHKIARNATPRSSACTTPSSTTHSRTTQRCTIHSRMTVTIPQGMTHEGKQTCLPTRGKYPSREIIQASVCEAK